MTPFRRRLMAYLDQHGPTPRVTIMCDMIPDSLAGRKGDPQNAARIVGRWVEPLIDAGLIRVEHHRGFYRHHELTERGRAWLRENPE